MPSLISRDKGVGPYAMVSGAQEIGRMTASTGMESVAGLMAHSMMASGAMAAGLTPQNPDPLEGVFGSASLPTAV